MPEPTTTTTDLVEAGQFDDAPGDESVPTPVSDPRQGHAFIDDERLLEWLSESSDGEESEPDEFEQEEDALEAEAFQTLRAEDEDWEVAEGGKYRPLSPLLSRTNRPCRLHETVQPYTTARRRPDWRCSRYYLCAQLQDCRGDPTGRQSTSSFKAYCADIATTTACEG